MNVEQVREYTLSLNGVTEDQPFGDDIITFRLEGKIFVCLWLGGGKDDIKHPEPRLALKLSPDRNEELREKFSAVTPAWHWNKKHWSDVYYENVEDSLVQEWIQESYTLVKSKLPKAVRQKYNIAQMTNIIIFAIIIMFFCSCRNVKTDSKQDDAGITAEMAYEGVNNYCHSQYDWSAAKEDPSIMYVEMGEETDSTYQVVFRSYTGAFVYFYVNKKSGVTRMEEYVPALDIRNDAGTINIINPKN
ncbi:MAG: MmcQ/YjbR family DNA-binding protein [Prevotella sp.]|jgi:predicted DNA-binding protein (MmcQ/YjbR family)|nr:MmcQ/YjbR family DNA-binding protein [Prevotella sp.]